MSDIVDAIHKAPKVVVLSHAPVGRLELAARQPRDASKPIEWFTATLFAAGVEARVSVYAEDVAHEAVEFFRVLADQWKGWNGQKRWASLEGELEITCAHDGIGYATFTVRLKREAHWAVHCDLMVELGQLAGLARSAERFFGSDDGGAD